MVHAYVSRWPSPKTQKAKRSHLLTLFRHSGVTHPAHLTELHLIAWCTHNNAANNTVRCRISEARTFLTWCRREGIVEHHPDADLASSTSPLKTYQRTYGKKQSKYPGRWLTREEAYDQLIGHTQDGTETGMRNELILRLGLLGLRAEEIADLTWKALAQLPAVAWTGKKRRPRTAQAGPALVALLSDYRTRYEASVGHTVTSSDPVICAAQCGTGARTRRLRWGQRISAGQVFNLVTALGRSSGLGHVAPHDLRRSAAGILHTATDANGAHHFDLLGIQKVLGHSDPATTMRSYLDPMDTAVYGRAATVLD